MLKKILFSLFIVALSLSLVACGKKVSKEEYDAIVAELEAKKAELDAKNDELAQKNAEIEELKNPTRTYKHDGVYTAFEHSLNNNAPQIVSVSVTIENDEIAGFFIDTLQSTAVKNGEETTGYNFNAKTKKQLGYHYYMFPASGKKVDGVLDVEAYKEWLAENNKKEWFEQANILEQYILENGVEAIEFDGTKPTNVAGVTVSAKDYVELAKKAIQNAKDGKLLAVTGYQDDIIWATATIDKDGIVSNYLIDVLQGQGIVDGTFQFKDKSKQELGYEYYMFPESGKKVDDVLDVDAYKEWLAENNKKEWFEQVAILCAEFEANGPYNMALDNNKFLSVSGVTISDNKYIQVLTQVKANVR